MKRSGGRGEEERKGRMSDRVSSWRVEVGVMRGSWRGGGVVKRLSIIIVVMEGGRLGVEKGISESMEE